MVESFQQSELSFTHAPGCILRDVRDQPCSPACAHHDARVFRRRVKDAAAFLGPICSIQPTAECFEGAEVQLGNVLCLICGKAVGSSAAPWHPEGGNPEVNSSRRDVRKELTVRATRGLQVTQQGQVHATLVLAGSQRRSRGTHASHA